MKTGSAVQKLMGDTETHRSHKHTFRILIFLRLRTEAGYPTSGDPPACELKGRGNNPDVANVTQGLGLWQFLWNDLSDGKLD
jgi:hypothetical protein